MFSTWDDQTKAYNILFADGTLQSFTTQELYEYYIFNDVGIKDEFVDIKFRLDNGESITADETKWDWINATNVYKGKLVITKINSSKVKPIHKEINGCKHENKYINEAGGIKFWVCPRCKSDLGNA